MTVPDWVVALEAVVALCGVWWWYLLRWLDRRLSREIVVRIEPAADPDTGVGVR